MEKEPGAVGAYVRFEITSANEPGCNSNGRLNDKNAAAGYDAAHRNRTDAHLARIRRCLGLGNVPGIMAQAISTESLSVAHAAPLFLESSIFTFPVTS